MASGFEVTTRPPSIERTSDPALTAAVLATADSGQAIRVSLNGASAIKTRNRIWHVGIRRGLLVRSRADGNEGLLIWAVRKP